MMNSFPQEILQNKCHKIIKEVLGDSYIETFIGNFTLREDDDEKLSYVNFQVFFSSGRVENVIGSGQGMVDATFTSLIERFSEEYGSLKQVKFDDFLLKVNFRESIPRSKSPVKIKLSLRGEHRKQRIYFSAESCSLAIAAITVIRKAFDYFINAEAAVFILKGDIQSARERNRQDLYNIYTSQMAELVKIISYEEIL